MTVVAPHPTVLAGFGLAGEPVALAGGMDPVFLVGDVVLKRAGQVDEEIWRAEVLDSLPENGYRVARPVRSVEGDWVVDGWIASEFVRGRADPTRIGDLLACGRAFHHALRRLPRPAFLDRLDHRWARAHRFVWDGADVDLIDDVRRPMDELQSMMQPIATPCQVIHSDLAGNVLFEHGVPPAVLDFSPWWAPAAYAEAILVIDGLLWHDVDPMLARGVTGPDPVQMLIRATVFRLVALNEGTKEGHPKYVGQLPLFDPVIAAIRSML